MVLLSGDTFDQDAVLKVLETYVDAVLEETGAGQFDLMEYSAGKVQHPWIH